MKTSSIVIIIAIVIIIISACDRDEEVPGAHPQELAGTWRENGYNREVTLDEDGYFDFDAQDTTGHGTWEAENGDLTFYLEEGTFKWLSSANNAPIGFTFQYEVTDSTLALEFVIMGDTSVARYTLIE